jgi:phage-related protein
MRDLRAVWQSNGAGAKKTKYAWVTQVALILAIFIGLFGAAPRVAAGESGVLRGIEAGTVRWVAIGKYYSDSTARGLDADSDRWVAKGRFYSDLLVRGLDADSERWVALGGYYSDKLARGIDADTARWVAHAAAIARSNSEVLLARGRDADSARWVAQGKFYSEFMARARDADSARWGAVGTYYAGLCTSGKLTC